MNLSAPFHKILSVRRFVPVIMMALLFLARPQTQVSAQAAQSTSWFTAPFGAEFRQSRQDGRLVHGSYAKRTLWAFLVSTACDIGIIDANCTDDPNEVATLWNQSIAGTVNRYIAYIYTTPPADLALWFQDTGQTLGFLPKRAMAQGIGFSGLSALLPLWKAFRNIAYLIVALVMVVIGFMVMFRKKIDPKTVVTVQNALPRIIIALLLITFSYAIVGVMIDLMYLSILLVVGIFQAVPDLLPSPAFVARTLGYTSPQSLYTQGGLVTNIYNIFGMPLGPLGSAGGVTTPTNIAFQALGIDPIAGKAASAAFLFLGLGLAALTGGVGFFALGIPGVLGPLLGLIIGLAVLFLVIKLFIFFLTSYIQIILALIFAPIQLSLEAFPGSNAFSNWIKNLFANIVVFPIGAMIFMLSAIFANMANQNNGGLGMQGSLWTPPFTPLLGSNAGSIAALLALGVLFTIPTIAGSIKEALKPKPFISAGPESIVGGLSQPAGVAFQVYQFYHQMEQTKLLREAITKQKSDGGHGGK
jgi:hypothetical protein